MRKYVTVELCGYCYFNAFNYGYILNMMNSSTSTKLFCFLLRKNGNWTPQVDLLGGKNTKNIFAVTVLVKLLLLYFKELEDIKSFL